MGWTYCFESREEAIDKILSSYKRYKTVGGDTVCLLDHRIVNNEIYLLTQLATANKTIEVSRTIAVVLLDRLNSGSGYQWGYKELSETVAPCYYNCPKSFVQRCTPTTNQYANKWRKKVMESSPWV